MGENRLRGLGLLYIHKTLFKLCLSNKRIFATWQSQAAIFMNDQLLSNGQLLRLLYESKSLL